MDQGVGESSRLTFSKTTYEMESEGTALAMLGSRPRYLRRKPGAHGDEGTSSGGGQGAVELKEARAAPPSSSAAKRTGARRACLLTGVGAAPLARASRRRRRRSRASRRSSRGGPACPPPAGRRAAAGAMGGGQETRGEDPGAGVGGPPASSCGSVRADTSPPAGGKGRASVGEALDSQSRSARSGVGRCTCATALELAPQQRRASELGAPPVEGLRRSLSVA